MPHKLGAIFLMVLTSQSKVQSKRQTMKKIASNFCDLFRKPDAFFSYFNVAIKSNGKNCAFKAFEKYLKYRKKSCEIVKRKSSQNLWSHCAEEQCLAGRSS